MAAMKLTAESLGIVGEGLLNDLLNVAIEKIAVDVEDRGADEKARVITLEIEFQPKVHNGKVYGVGVDFAVKSKVPAHRTNQYVMEVQPTRNGAQFVFNPESADNPKQRTLDEAKDE